MQTLEDPSLDFGNALGATEFGDLNGIFYVYLDRHSICHETDPRQAMLQTLFHEMVVNICASSKMSLSARGLVHPKL